jgi:hypothetical protein
MPVLLFDSLSGGHHEPNLIEFSAALRPTGEVWIAAPRASEDQLVGHCDGFVPLDQARSVTGGKGGLSRLRADKHELASIRSAVREAGAAHVIHMFADALLPALTLTRGVGARVSPLLFRPRAHYPHVLGSQLVARERLEGALYEGFLRRWRKREDANAVLSLDETAVTTWQDKPGAPAVWIPEAPVRNVALNPTGPRLGCVVFGRLSGRKGIPELARAISLRPTNMRVTLAGEVDPTYAEQLASDVAQMRGAGAEVIVRDRWLSYADALRLLAEARCAVVPYPRHFGSSKVLIEAAAVGTPSVASSFGLLGYQTRTWGLGVTADPGDAQGLRKALDELLEERVGARDAALKAFASRYTAQAFSRALGSVVRDPRDLGEPDA